MARKVLLMHRSIVPNVFKQLSKCLRRNLRLTSSKANTGEDKNKNKILLKAIMQ